MRKSESVSLQLKIEQKIDYKPILFFGELVLLTLTTNKPIPPATHGTICLNGKQNK